MLGGTAASSESSTWEESIDAGRIRFPTGSGAEGLVDQLTVVLINLFNMVALSKPASRGGMD